MEISGNHVIFIMGQVITPVAFIHGMCITSLLSVLDRAEMFGIVELFQTIPFCVIDKI